MGEMGQSAGAADAEMGIVEQSLNFKLNRLKETWIGMLQELADRGVLGNTIDTLSNLSEGIDKVINSAVGLPTVASAIISVYSALKGGGISNIKSIPVGICLRAA